jgi:hypothetical protein
MNSLNDSMNYLTEHIKIIKRVFKAYESVRFLTGKLFIREQRNLLKQNNKVTAMSIELYSRLDTVVGLMERGNNIFLAAINNDQQLVQENDAQFASMNELFTNLEVEKLKAETAQPNNTRNIILQICWRSVVLIKTHQKIMLQRQIEILG